MAETPLHALEQFVTENDDLLELEGRIGKFNIFDALGIVRRELQHSNFLAWLLDPSESHGQGNVFLSAVLMDMLKRAPADKRPFNPVMVDGADLRGIEIRREWRNIDLLITSHDPAFVIAIENKIDSGERPGQLERYKRLVNEEYPQRPSMFIFLTPDGLAASDRDWVPWSYRDLLRVLTEVRRSQIIGGDVEAFLDHYVRLIESRLMLDHRLVELCNRIYTEHREAIDLIVKHANVGHADVIGRIGSIIERRYADQFDFFRRTAISLHCAPKAWAHASPPIGKYCNNNRIVLVYKIAMNSKKRIIRLTLEAIRKPA